GRIELCFTTNIWQPQSTRIVEDPFNCASNNSLSIRVVNIPRPELIHHRNGERPHRTNVTNNTTHTGGRPLKRVDKSWGVMRFHFERGRKPLPNIYNTRILANTYQQVLTHFLSAFLTKLSQMAFRRLIRTVLGPHH